MPWTGTVTLDADKADVGNATATFTDTDATEFSHSARVQLNAAGLASFVAAAKAARDAWKAKKVAEAPLVNNLVTALTEADA